jgi:hypothetical protein
MQNPIGEADLEWILHRNCEDTEQLQVQKKTSDCEAGICFLALISEHASDEVRQEVRSTGM